jgi:hypothetical protein
MRRSGGRPSRRLVAVSGCAHARNGTWERDCLHPPGDRARLPNRLLLFAVLSVQIAQFREDLLCNRARQTESWRDRIMQRERPGGQSSMILSGHDSVVSGCGFAALCSLRLNCFLLGCPRPTVLRPPSSAHRLRTLDFRLPSPILRPPQPISRFTFQVSSFILAGFRPPPSSCALPSSVVRPQLPGLAEMF